MPVFGLTPSHAHADNGMTLPDMQACVSAARALGEVIVLRSGGAWSQRWLALGYPAAGGPLGGRTADWGPQAGLLPCLGRFGRAGADGARADQDTRAAQRAVDDGLAARRQLVLSFAELQMQLTRAAESPPRTALYRLEAVPGAGATDYMLWARRSGDGRVFVFRAVRRDDGNYGINVLTQDVAAPVSLRAASDMTRYEPLEVMASTAGAGGRPLTGGYELVAACPKRALGTGRVRVLDIGGAGGRGPVALRVRRCIDRLGQEMAAQGPLQRVHAGGDGLPLTVFHPDEAWQDHAELRPYQDVSTLLTLPELRSYASVLHAAGYEVPRHWTWGLAMAALALRCRA